MSKRKNENVFLEEFDIEEENEDNEDNEDELEEDEEETDEQIGIREILLKDLDEIFEESLRDLKRCGVYAEVRNKLKSLADIYKSIGACSEYMNYCKFCNHLSSVSFILSNLRKRKIKMDGIKLFNILFSDILLAEFLYTVLFGNILNSKFSKALISKLIEKVTEEPNVETVYSFVKDYVITEC